MEEDRIKISSMRVRIAIFGGSVAQSLTTFTSGRATLPTKWKEHMMPLFLNFAVVNIHGFRLARVLNPQRLLVRCAQWP